MTFAEVVVQGQEERFVDRNGMALFGVLTASRIPNPEGDEFDKYGGSEMKELWKALNGVKMLRAQVKFTLLF